ncbi:Na+/H+ antiporter subunit E [Roseococcus microcysteis]|uniref:Na+/H+ antiporter subunit E n=1 Tax=Roseococcus microcysteis TaxID=2771361 RepID=UPI00168A5AD9|nr:Na+/H+ antiporter subunit E [Roseococcus microcysteis]
MREGLRTSWIAGRRGLLLGLLWFVLVGPDPAALLPGLLAVGAATWLSLRLLPPVSALRAWRLALMLPPFLWRSLVGGVDVARRAFHPRLPLKPGWVEAPCRLGGGGRAVLGGGFSLMPGTLVAGTRRGQLLVHCLDTSQPVLRAVADDEAALARAIPPAEAPPR